MHNAAVQDVNVSGKVLLTGASGFIGGRLREALVAADVDVVAIRRPGSPPAKKGRSVEVAYEDRAGIKNIIRSEKPDYVLHVAGATKGVTYDDFRQANVVPTQNLLEALREEHADVKRFVFISSLASFGPSSPSNPHTEKSERRPIEFYGQSKLEAERVVENIGNGLPWTIIRPSGVYGPGDADYLNLFREVEKGRNVYFGNRKRWFSAIYVDDLVTSILMATTHANAVGRGFFVCDGKPVTWETFQETMVRVSGKRVRSLDLPEFLVSIAAMGGEFATMIDKQPRLFNRQKAKMGAAEAWLCKSDSLRETLGWKSHVDIDEGIRRTFAWYRQEKWI
jgi:nucleoside-diphosphate-sugar epimerase